MATATLIPTITPTSTPAAPLVILVLPADMDPVQSNLYQTTVYELAQAAGYRFQVRNTLTVTDLDAGDSHGFTVSDARFEVVSGDLKLKAGLSLNFEAEPTVAVTVTATDAGGLSYVQAFTMRCSHSANKRSPTAGCPWPDRYSSNALRTVAHASGDRSTARCRRRLATRAELPRLTATSSHWSKSVSSAWPSSGGR